MNNHNNTTVHAAAEAQQFDPYEWENFFFGSMERDEASALLLKSEVGAFLIRESKSMAGGYSLSVREADTGDIHNQIHHYFISKKEIDDGNIRYEMCGSTFVNIPFLINHYKINKLQKTYLTKPVEKEVLCKVIGEFKFDGERSSDLPFEQGEILEILSKPEESWWMARNVLGNTGLIPVPYVRMSNPNNQSITNSNSICYAETEDCSTKRFSMASVNSENEKIRRDRSDSSSNDKQISAWVKVIWNRVPSIYDSESLTLKEGQLIYLTEALPNGMCRGYAEENKKTGLFPFSYVELTDDKREPPLYR